MLRKTSMLAVASAAVLLAAGCGANSGAPASNANSGGNGHAAESASPPASGNPNFPTHTITLIVPDNPGGSMDTSGRILAEYLPKYLPNHPSVIVKNMPGGNDSVGINTVLQAKPDGYTLGIFPMPGVIVGPYFGSGQYDMTKMEWLGETFDQGYVFVVSSKSNIHNLKDLQSHKNLKISVTGATTSPGIAVIETMKALNTPFTLVPSKGSSQSVLAVSQGAVDATVYPYSAVGQAIQSGMAQPLFVYTDKRLPQLPNTPTIAELGHPELTNVISTRGDVATTPGVPSDIVDILRKAIQQTAQDPDYQAKMNAANLTPQFTDGATLQTQVEKDAEALKKDVPDIQAYVKQEK
ncbi:MAG: tripartite tricarboxylate transporter substrate binding protein [Alicyclobacillus sp.]|nr:tripartite tricarboxylate transporter substrate binding protein [Alicyclobacillus sp.]